MRHKRRSADSRGAPAEEVSLKISPLPGEAPHGLLSCHARAQGMLFVSACWPIIAARSEARKGTRRLTCYKQALFGLAWAGHAVCGGMRSCWCEPPLSLPALRAGVGGGTAAGQRVRAV